MVAGLCVTIGHQLNEFKRLIAVSVSPNLRIRTDSGKWFWQSCGKVNRRLAKRLYLSLSPIRISLPAMISQVR